MFSAQKTIRISKIETLHTQILSTCFLCLNVHFIVKEIRAVADTLNTHEVPGTVVSALHVLSHLIFTATTDQILLLTWSANKETDTQSAYITCLRSQSSKVL